MGGLRKIRVVAGGELMKISGQREQEKLILQIEGRLDTATSPQLEQELGEGLDGVRELVLDFTPLEYISSAGLRVLLAAHKKMAKQEGQLVIRGANEGVREVFTITGFMDILHVEREQTIMNQVRG